MPRKRQWHRRSRGFGHARKSAHDRGGRQSPSLNSGRIRIAKEFILDSSLPTTLSVKCLTAFLLIRISCPAGNQCRDRRERDFDVDMQIAISEARFDSVSPGWRITKGNEMNGSRYYGVRVEGAKFGIGF